MSAEASPLSEDEMETTPIPKDGDEHFSFGEEDTDLVAYTRKGVQRFRKRRGAGQGSLRCRDTPYPASREGNGL